MPLPDPVLKKTVLLGAAAGRIHNEIKEKQVQRQNPTSRSQRSRNTETACLYWLHKQTVSEQGPLTYVCASYLFCPTNVKRILLLFIPTQLSQLASFLEHI